MYRSSLPIGHGSKTHKQAMNEYKKECKKESRQKQITKNIFRVAITDLKLGAASKHFETLLSLLACCDTDIGNIGHSRKNMDSIIYCIEKVINRRTAEWLSMPLPSTQLPPHYCATVDKGTPSRINSQAVLIVARDQNGTPSPITVAAPEIYFDFQGASYILAKQLINAIENNFSSDIFSQLCGVAADGSYQASGFQNQLYEILSIPEIHKDLAVPITWDPTHLLNLGVTDVRDSKSESEEFFRLFIKRCNVFNHILSHGKGFLFLQILEEPSLRPVTYAAQRFASSSYNQWLKIERSLSSYWKAFEILHPNREETEEWQYMICGSDFIQDLLGLIDILKPVVDLMLHMQSQHCPVWKLKEYRLNVRDALAQAENGFPEAYPNLSKVIKDLHPGGTYKSVTLLEGWLISEYDDGGNDMI